MLVAALHQRQQGGIAENSTIYGRSGNPAHTRRLSAPNTVTLATLTEIPRYGRIHSASSHHVL